MRCWNKICGLFLIFFLGGLICNAQTLKNIRFENSPSKHLFQKFPVSADYLDDNKKETKVLQPLQVIAPDYYTQHFGFFCKRELEVEKFTKVPFRFRLGSLQQCNYYEGKK